VLRCFEFKSLVISFPTNLKIYFEKSVINYNISIVLKMIGHGIFDAIVAKKS